MDYEIIYQKAINVFGEEAQVMQTIQELAELIKELSDLKREGRTDTQKLATEIADCEIMIGQMKALFSSKFEDFNNTYKSEVERKHKKLQGYLDRSN